MNKSSRCFTYFTTKQSCKRKNHYAFSKTNKPKIFSSIYTIYIYEKEKMHEHVESAEGTKEDMNKVREFRKGC